VKESTSNSVNVRPMLYRPSTRTSRVGTYQIYRQKKLRQQRVLLLGVGLLLLFGLLILTGWGLCKAASPLLTRIYPTSPMMTTTPQHFERLLEKDFGPIQTPSLLYENNLGTLLLARTADPTASGQLMPIAPSHEDTHLKASLEALLAQYPASRFVPHIYFYNPQDNTYVEINGYSPVSAASVIKLPILLDYLMHLDEQSIALDTPLLYADFHRGGGAGELQYQPAGQEFLANQIASQMIRISDNTCTNMMISYLGGTDAVNHRLQQLGLLQTRIRNWLPDLTGTNTISQYEMVTILYNIEQGKLISDGARTNGLDILFSTHNRRLLVTPLPKEAKVAHKTGDIGTALGDSGIVYMPDGRKYIMSMQVERPYNDYTARDMVQRASRLIYDYVETQPNRELLQARM
jgi:beta-lactamase class A